MKRNTVHIDYDQLHSLYEKIMNLEERLYKANIELAKPKNKTIYIENSLFGKHEVHTDEEAVGKLAKNLKESKSDLILAHSEMEEISSKSWFRLIIWKLNQT